MKESEAKGLWIFVITAPGISGVTARELAALDLRAEAVEPAGVTLRGSLDDLYRANLWLRTASRVVVRIGQFGARTFAELERHAAKIDWTPYVGKGDTFRVRATARKSRLYHTAAVEQRIAKAIAMATGASPLTASARSTGGEEAESDEDGGQLFMARVERDTFTISADSSGALLHMRGYRKAVAKAPLRETLAAAALLASGWEPGSALLDPFCGSGTIPIEGALLARGMAPGASRAFAFQRWPDFDRSTWTRLLGEAKDSARPACERAITGSDRDDGAVRASLENAERAGVAADVTFERRTVSEIAPTARFGWIVTNPPYGVRLSPDDAIRNLYARLGAVARERFSGWGLAILSADRALEAQLRLALEERLSTSNGGIPVRLMTGSIPRSTSGA